MDVHKTQRVFFEIPIEHVMVSAVVVSVTLGPDGKRRFELITLGDAEPWDSIGMLRAALKREEARMARMWPD